MKEKLKIEIDHWDHNCSDGCCYTYGTNININGVDLEIQNQDIETQIEQILKHLGYEVEIVSLNNGE